MNWLDLTGAILSLSATYCFTKAYRLAWITSFFAIGINFCLYLQKGIFGQACDKCEDNWGVESSVTNISKIKNTPEIIGYNHNVTYYKFFVYV